MLGCYWIFHRNTILILKCKHRSCDYRIFSGYWNELCSYRMGQRYGESTMINPSVIINFYSDIRTLKDKISCNILDILNILRTCLENNNGIFLLRTLKFERAVSDPLFSYNTNFIEYLNQLFAYMVEIAS